jgi:hypothetical protein
MREARDVVVNSRVVRTAYRCQWLFSNEGTGAMKLKDPVINRLPD